MSVNQRVVKTACGMCIHECGITVHVEDEKVVKIEGLPEHPDSQGWVCVKAHQIPEWVYHEDRLKYPMKKENGGWKRISWDEALDTIATKLTTLREREGPTALAVIAGDPIGMAYQVGWDVISRFCDVYGTPNIFDPGNLCGNAGFLASVVTIGKMCSPDLENSRCIVLWAQDPHKSFLPYVRRINEALRKGAKLVVINPKRTAFAKRADIHVQPRPATDGALALAMLNTIISEALYDKEFVKNWTAGFDKLQEHVRQYTPEWAETITWVAAEDIRKIARLYATTKPACISASVTKLQQCQCGFQNFRTLTILEAITGHLDVPGGSVRRSSGLTRRPHRLLDKMGTLKRTGAERYPILHEFAGRVFALGGMPNWADLVLTGKPYHVKMMIVSGANPAVTWPNTNKIKEALRKLDFLVVMDVFMTATAEMAHLVLPACTFLEKLSTTGMSLVAMLRRPAIPPLWESWSDCKFWLELARRMGYQEYFPWKDDEEVLDHFLQPTGLAVKYLRDEHPTGILPLVTHYDEYKKRGFRTPSGKVELYSEELLRMGYDPLPTYQEPRESPISTPELAKDYPLVLATGAREMEYWHSQHRNLSKLRQRNPEPVVDIHPATAKKYGISDGEVMVVETKRGSIEIKARVTEDIMPDVLILPHGWPESCENVLTDDTPVDPVSGYMAFTGILCRVSRKVQPEVASLK